MVIHANPATPVSCAPAPSCPITADGVIEQIAQCRLICPRNLRTARTASASPAYRSLARVRCACLSLIRAKSLPDQLPKQPVIQSDGITLAFHGETAMRLN
jgi:hypothetical protein